MVVPHVIDAFDRGDERERQRKPFPLPPRVESSGYLDCPQEHRTIDTHLHVRHRREAIVEANDGAAVEAEQIRRELAEGPSSQVPREAVSDAEVMTEAG